MNILDPEVQSLNWSANTHLKNMLFVNSAHVTAMMKRDGKHIVTNVIESTVQRITLELLKELMQLINS